MNHVARILKEIYEESHKNKYDGLDFLVNSDKTTKEMYSQRTNLSTEQIGQLKDMWDKI